MSDQVIVQELDAPAQDLLTSLFKDTSKFARFGNVGYTMSVHYKHDADDIKSMAIRADDVWVVTFPRSGTTRTQELIWLVKNNFDYEAASKRRLTDRYFWILPNQINNDQRKSIRKTTKEEVINAPSPRFIRTHNPFSLLPANLLDTAKVVYMARDPRDVAVSFYHHNRLVINYEGDFKTYWNLFHNSLVYYTPYFAHIKEAWELRHHPNMLFLFYEDMSRDLPSCIKRIANFFGKNVSNEQLARLCEHLDINNFRNNKSVNQSFLDPNAESFIRKGEIGGWRGYFDEEMAAQAQAWMRENLTGTDLRFPDSDI